MKLLILGGTVFLGKHLALAAIHHGHELTLFNRGQSNPDIFPDVERLHGDRDGGLQALAGRTWDAVLDVSGYLPRLVRDSARALSGSGRYAFISTISVYADPGIPGMNENAPVGQLEDPTIEEINGETYGPLKVLCELAVQEEFGDRALIIRPGLIVGPDDKTDRFTYWPVRMSDGGDVLVPDRKDQPSQFIDVRDLAEWTITMIESGASGVFNATGPASPYALGDVLESCKRESGDVANLVWVSPTFLEENEVKTWSELPFVLPFDGSGDGFGQIDISRALGRGLSFRALDETVRDTLNWYRNSRPAGPLKAGMTRERESELLGKAAQLS